MLRTTQDEEQKSKLGYQLAGGDRQSLLLRNCRVKLRKRRREEDWERKGREADSRERKQNQDEPGWSFGVSTTKRESL